MRVFVKAYNEGRHDLDCIVVESGAVIRVDPFVGCAIDTSGPDYAEKGAALVGKEYEMTDYFLSRDGTYLPREGSFEPYNVHNEGREQACEATLAMRPSRLWG